MGGAIHSLGNWNYFLAFFSALIESFPIIGVLVPGMNIMILIGGFWWKMHPIATIFCATFGAMLGNYAGYLLWKKYGMTIVKNYGDYVWFGQTEQKILENQIQKNGFWYIVLGKFHGTLRAFIPFVAGMSKMKSKNFWIYNAIGSFLWAIIINIIGILFVEKYEEILKNIDKIFMIIIVIFVLYLWFFQREKVQKYWSDKNAEMLEKIHNNNK